MVQIAERTSILDQEADKILLIERANRLWDRQAIFEWYMYSCNSSDISDSDSSDEEGNDSGFESSTWEDDTAKVSTEPDLLNALQQPPYAQQFYGYQPDQILKPSSKTRHWYEVPLSAGPEALSDPYGQDPLIGATDELQHAQASLDGRTPSNYSVSEADNQFNVSQRTPKGNLQSPVDDISYRNMQLSSCLSCGATTMWPGSSFCLTCVLNYDPRENLSDASNITSSAGDYIEPTFKANPWHFACCHAELSDISFVRSTNKTEMGRKKKFTKAWPRVQDWGAVTPRNTQFDVSSSASLQGTEVSRRPLNCMYRKITMVCQRSADAGICHSQDPHDRSWVREPRSNHPYDRDKKKLTDNEVRQRKNLLV